MSVISSIEKAEIFPLNPPASGSYSFNLGYPIVNFMIAPQDKLLDTTTLRLNGVLRLNAPLSTEDNPVHAGNGSGTPAIDGICLNSRIGVASCIQQVTLSTQTGQTLEVVRGYGRYVASVASATLSQSDLDGVVSATNPGCGSRTFVGGKQCNVDVYFSVPLRTGLLSSGQALPLAQIQGLSVTLELAPDATALSGYSTYDALGVETKVLFTPTNVAFYQLRDLSLSYDLLVPADPSKISSSGVLEYNSISHQYSVLNSSDQTINLNLGTANTLSVVHNFIPTPFISSYTYDSYGTFKLLNGPTGTSAAAIKRVSFLRGGSRFPLDYAVDVEAEGTLGVAQTDLETKYLDAVKPLISLEHCLMSTNTQTSKATAISFDDVPTPRILPTLTEPKPVFGAGVRMDVLSQVGVSFKDTTYGLRVESALNGASPNSVFTYCFAKNMLQYSPQGVMVSS